MNNMVLRSFVRKNVKGLCFDDSYLLYSHYRF